MVRRCRGLLHGCCRPGLGNYRFDDVAHCIRRLNVALFRSPGRCGRLRGLGPLHRTVDEEPGAVRALDLSLVSEIEEHPGVAERPAAAVAGGDRLVNVDGFKGSHMRPETPGRVP